jgi:hypothetical protein
MTAQDKQNRRGIAWQTLLEIGVKSALFSRGAIRGERDFDDEKLARFG